MRSMSQDGMGCFASASAVKGARTFGFLLLPTMLMRPNKAETAVHGYHRSGDIAVRIGKVLNTAELCCVTYTV